MNNLAKIEQCNIKVIDYYILLDLLYIYYYYFILAYYYPIPALSKAPYIIAMTSSRHRHDIVNTSPLHGDASPKDHRPSFSRGTTRSTSAPIATRTRNFHRQCIARHFGPRGTVALADCIVRVKSLTSSPASADHHCYQYHQLHNEKVSL